MHSKCPIWGKEEIMRKLYYECSVLLWVSSQVPKTLKRMKKTPKFMQRILYEERERDLQKRVFWVFMSVVATETLKSVESMLYLKIKHYEKSLVSVFLSYLRTKTLNYMEKHLFFMDCYVPNLKVHPKTPIWGI